MATASAHAHRRRHPATEAGLWLIWITARLSGLATLARRARRLAARLADSDAAHWLAATMSDLADATTDAGHTLHRLLVRVELAAADLLTGPAPELLDLATTRLRRRAGWLALAGGVLANLTYLALR
jgi:hypothetical protein